MSWSALGYLRAVFDSGLSSNAKLVALALLRHADERGFCWPGSTRLQRATGLSRTTVRRCRTELKMGGWITTTDPAGPGTVIHYVLRSDRVQRDPGPGSERPRTGLPQTPRTNPRTTH